MCRNSLQKLLDTPSGSLLDRAFPVSEFPKTMNSSAQDKKNNGFTMFSELRTNKTLVLLCRLSSGQKNTGFTVFSELWRKKKTGFTGCSELRTKKTLEIQCFRDFVVWGKKQMCLGAFSFKQKRACHKGSHRPSGL